MNEQIDIGVIRFSENFTSAEKPDGEELQFTRFEARALQFFSRNPDRLVTRAQLLDSVSSEGSDKNDRNIDFLVNRLRKKLGDTPQEPRFIATRYGEGYMWIGQSSSTYIAGNDSYLVIGPVRVAGSLADSPFLESSFCQSLQKALKFRLSDDQRVTVDPNCRPAFEFGNLTPKIGVEMTFFTDSSTAECIVTVRKFREGKILAITRITVSGVEMPTGQEIDGPQQLAEWILREIWREHTSVESTGEPLPVAIQAASQSKKVADIYIWEETDPWIRKLVVEHPDDFEIQLKYATHLHTKYVVGGFMLFKNGIDDRKRDEDEIESLVQKALPFVHSKPELAIMAAKLLFFLGRGYENFAADLAESAHKECTIITHSLPIIGQIRGFLGNVDHGIEALDQAINLAEAGSKAHLYALVIKCNIQMAAREIEGLAATKKELFHEISPIGKLFFEPIYADPAKPSLKARAAVMMLSKKEAAAILLHSYYISARLFKVPEHKENLMRTLVSLLTRRFGIDIIPDEVTAAIPNLIRRYGR